MRGILLAAEQREKQAQAALSASAVSQALEVLMQGLQPPEGCCWVREQTLLEQFSWMEADKARTMATRNFGHSAAVTEQPMFCFETCIKLFYWSTAVYAFKEVGERSDCMLGHSDGCCSRGQISNASNAAIFASLGLLLSCLTAFAIPIVPGIASFSARYACASMWHTDNPICNACQPACPVSLPSLIDCWPRLQDWDGADIEVALNLYKLDHFELLWAPAEDTKCIMAWNRDTIVLAFRGTASLSNVLADLQVG